MFNTINNAHFEKSLADSRFRSENWEEDIDEVTLEECGIEDDPSGFRVKFHRQGMKSKFENDFDTFYIGASFLGKRYKRIIESGYTAPMTEKALALLEGKDFAPLPQAAMS